MNQRNEWLSGNLPGRLWEQKKSYIGHLLVRKPASNRSTFLGLHGATPAQRGAWGALTAYFYGKEPGELIRPCWSDYEGIMVVRLPQEKKTHHQPQSKSNNFHPIPSRNSHQWSHSVVSCFKILLGNQATPLPPNCLPLILHLANGKIQTSHEKMVPASYVLTTCKVHFQRTKINPSK